MARGPRLDAPGTLHHVMVRGIEKRQIFEDDQDREDFLHRLGKLLEQCQASCFAWMLIPHCQGVGGNEWGDQGGGSRRRGISKARAAFCYVCMTRFGVTGKRLSHALEMSPTAIYLASMRGEAFVNRADHFQKALDRYLNNLSASPLL
jgi:hypothetical protein